MTHAAAGALLRELEAPLSEAESLARWLVDFTHERHEWNPDPLGAVADLRVSHAGMLEMIDQGGDLPCPADVLQAMTSAVEGFRENVNRTLENLRGEQELLKMEVQTAVMEAETERLREETELLQEEARRLQEGEGNG